MFRLARGVTGFRHYKEPELPVVSIRDFRGACYEAARAAGRAVEQVVEDTYPRNFHSAILVGLTDRSTVLCNAIYPWIAFVEKEATGVVDPHAFADPPAWSASFAEAGFTVMSRRILESPLSVVDTAALGESEWSQIRHWGPATVGDTVFNSWD